MNPEADSEGAPRGSEAGPVGLEPRAPASAEPPVTVLTRQHCSLCDKAIETVSRICGEFPVSWTSTDVDGDRELRAEYGDRVPVILIDGREHGYGAVEPDRFRAALRRR